MTTSVLATAVAKELRLYLMRRGMSQQRIADQLGEHQTWVSRRLTGQTEITLAELERLAVALDVSVIDLLPESAFRRRRPPTDGYVPRYIARSALGLAA